MADSVLGSLPDGHPYQPLDSAYYIAAVYFRNRSFSGYPGVCLRVMAGLSGFDAVFEQYDYLYIRFISVYFRCLWTGFFPRYDLREVCYMQYGEKSAILTGAVCLALVMGLYQAYLGCITLVVLVYLIFMASEGRWLDEIKRYLWGGSVIGVAGLCLYEIALHLELSFYKVSLSAYNGADNISIRTIMANFFPSVKRAYVTAWRYLTGGSYRWNALPPEILKAIFIAAAVGIAGMEGVLAFRPKLRPRTRTVIHVLLFGACVLLLPIAANVVFILAPESAFLEQQTAPMALFVPLIFVLLLKGMSYREAEGDGAVKPGIGEPARFRCTKTLTLLGSCNKIIGRRFCKNLGDIK